MKTLILKGVKKGDLIEFLLKEGYKSTGYFW